MFIIDIKWYEYILLFIWILFYFHNILEFTILHIWLNFLQTIDLQSDENVISKSGIHHNLLKHLVWVDLYQTIENASQSYKGLEKSKLIIVQQLEFFRKKSYVTCVSLRQLSHVGKSNHFSKVCYSTIWTKILQIRIQFDARK